MSTFFYSHATSLAEKCRRAVAGLGKLSVQNMSGLEPRPKPLCDPEFMAANKNEMSHDVTNQSVFAVYTTSHESKVCQSVCNANWPTVAKSNEFLN